MKELIKQIISKKFCHHEWKLEKEVTVYEKDSSKRPVKVTYIYICSKCGDFNKITIEP